MADDILDDVRLLIFVIFLGSVVCIIGYYAQNGWIVDFGVALAGAIPITRLILWAIDYM